jgi:hypothetical protein
MEAFAKLPSPALVIDWNLLCTMRSTQEIPNDFSCVVPDQIFHEILTTDDAKRMGYIRKFGRWATRNAARLWYGRTVEDLFKIQRDNSGHPLVLQDLFHPEQTRRLRLCANDPTYDWGQFIQAAEDGKFLEVRKKLTERAVKFCSNLAERFHERLKKTPSEEERILWVRTYQPSPNALANLYQPFWCSDWSGRSRREFNQLAIVKWTRLLAWYTFKRYDRQTRKFENNIDDAMYAMLATCCGFIGTNDTGLQNTVGVLFSTVQVITQNHLIPLKTVP